jgi:hypothetical protein
MPLSAIATGYVDHVLDPAAIPDHVGESPKPDREKDDIWPVPKDVRESIVSCNC